MSSLAEVLVSFYTQQFPIIVISFPFMLLPYILLERWRPVATPPTWREYLTNFAISTSTIAVTAPIGLAAAHAAYAIRQNAPWPTLAFTFSDIGIGMPAVDPALRILAMIFIPLLMHDLWFYWSHRLEHKVRFLWRFHQLHHSDINMNASTYARDHFLQSTWRAFFSMFTIGLIFDLELKDAEQAALLSNLFLILLSQFYHSATRIQLPWLDRILVTPQVHRLHHSVLPKHQDKNFADALPIFDILFGTYVRPARDEFPETGLSDGTKPPAKWWQAQIAPVASIFKRKFN
jgi:sterol desaturase/sphingolipid hydroxylase (fatty acid hydroxylase superfamily)